MNKLFSTVVVSIFLAGSASANVCKIRVENTFTHNITLSDASSDLKYTEEVNQLISSVEGYKIVDNTIKVKEKKTVHIGGCNAGEYECEVEVTKDNPDYDYKIIVAQDFKYNDVFSVQKTSDRYDVSLLPSYNYKVTISMIDANGDTVQMDGKKLDHTRSEKIENIKSNELDAKVNNSLNLAHEMIKNNLNALPSCDELKEMASSKTDLPKTDHRK